MSDNPIDVNEVESVVPFVTTIGECNIPSYFQKSQDVVEYCNNGMANGLFKAALGLNSIFSLIFYKEVTIPFVLGFIIFHVFLYYFIHKILVEVSIGEWKTFQAYKHAVASAPDSNQRIDTPLSQFRSITTFLFDQPINKQKMMYLILIVSFVFVWFPLLIHSEGESKHRFDLSKIRKYLSDKI